MPPQIACRFTPAEAAALAVMAAQVAKHGRCDLALDHLAALAGVGRTTVRNAIAEVRKLGLVTVEVRRLRAFRNDTNVVRIVAAAWQLWISMRDRKRAGGDHPRQAEAGSRYRGARPA